MTLVEKFGDDLLDPTESLLLGDQPNTYALSKCLSEDLMVRSGLPIGIARPSIGKFDRVDVLVHFLMFLTLTVRNKNS